MSRHSKATGFHPVRHDRLIQEYRHDPYKSSSKLHEPTLCSGCGAVFHEGRWQWLPRPPLAQEEMCPACHRIADEYPAGYVHLSGKFPAGHDQEVLITTTGIHLARPLGEALRHAYQGELEFHYNEEEMLLRVHWSH